MNRTTSRELSHRINSIQQGLELQSMSDKSLLSLLLETKRMDESTIEDLIKNEGEMIAQEEFIYTVENLFLESQTLQKIREYKDFSSEDWNFLTPKEQNIINNTIKLLKKTTLEYTLTRAELMIMRKEIIDFVTNRLKQLNSTLNPTELINIIINNYTYLDTLNNLGYDKDEDGYLSKFYLDENLSYKKI